MSTFWSGFYYLGNQSASDALQRVDEVLAADELYLSPQPHHPVDFASSVTTLEQSGSVGLNCAERRSAGETSSGLGVALGLQPDEFSLPADSLYEYFTCYISDHYIADLDDESNYVLNRMVSVTLRAFAAFSGVYGGIGSGPQPPFETVQTGRLQELWWGNLFGPELIEQWGRDWLLAAPARRIDRLERGALALYRNYRALETGPHDTSLLEYFRKVADNTLRLV